MTWHKYDTAELEREYTPASRVENIQTYLDQYATEGRHSRQTIRHDRLQYGQHTDEWMWLARQPNNLANEATLIDEERRKKLIVFIHGGFWRRLSADDGTFLTNAWHQLGFDYASINYSLCPREPLETLVGQVLKAIQHLQTSYDATNITLIGHSAGAHLIAMGLTNKSIPKFEQAILVSGIFDLEPITKTSVNDAIRLDEKSAHRLSPIHLVTHAQDTPMTIIWGENETDEFKRQSRDFASAWGEVKNHSLVFSREIATRNHFDILYDLPAKDVIGLRGA